MPKSNSGRKAITTEDKAIALVTKKLRSNPDLFWRYAWLDFRELPDEEQRRILGQFRLQAERDCPEFQGAAPEKQQDLDRAAFQLWAVCSAIQATEEKIKDFVCRSSWGVGYRHAMTEASKGKINRLVELLAFSLAPIFLNHLSLFGVRPYRIHPF